MNKCLGVKTTANQGYIAVLMVPDKYKGLEIACSLYMFSIYALLWPLLGCFLVSRRIWLWLLY